jgi:hypothetical protein
MTHSQIQPELYLPRRMQLGNLSKWSGLWFGGTSLILREGQVNGGRPMAFMAKSPNALVAAFRASFGAATIMMRFTGAQE